MRNIILSATFAVLAAAPARAQLRIELVAPAGTPPDARVYVAGSFNMWDPAMAAYRLNSQGNGRYAITLPAAVRGAIEFKFTLGSWERVETNGAGGDVANRTFNVPDTGAVTYPAVVAAWKSGGAPAAARAHTAAAAVTIISDTFRIPQLNRTRRVWIYLPASYASAQGRYPVLYMHDGQNVFDAATSYAGEWGVDEALDSLRAQMIVVGIDNGGDHRMIEYNAWNNARYGKGEGAAYVDFIVHTLKPYIDTHFRTKADRAHTGIAGSSMGGLISYYAALAYPQVFGKAAVFSPSFWIAPEVVDFTKAAHGPRARLFFVSAGAETRLRQQAPVYDGVLAALQAKGWREGKDYVAYIKEDGAHSEWFWRREFVSAFTWLFPNDK